MTLNRNELITAINDLFDENIDLRVKNQLLEVKDRAPIEPETKGETLNQLSLKAIAYAKKKLFDDVIKSGYGSSINVWEDEDTKSLHTTSLDQWFDNKIYTSYIPDNMSKEDIKNLLYTEIKDLYDKEKAKALKEYEKQKEHPNE